MPETWPEYWPYLVAFLSAAIGIPAAIHAAMTKDDVRAAIGWVGIILLSPLVGAAFYLVAGINRIRRTSIGHRRMRTDNRAHSAGMSRSQFVPSEPELASLKHLGDQVSTFALGPDNAIVPLDGGDVAYPAMIRAIRSARRHVALSSYIFDNDIAGLGLARALILARKRGVEVRVLIDAVGARYSRPSIVGPLREGGVSVALFLGSVFGFRLPYANLRNHRKIMVVDGETGFTGGMNIRSQFTSMPGGGAPSHDTHFEIRGPLVAQLLATFVDDWLFTTGEHLEGKTWEALAPEPTGGRCWARTIVSGPDLPLAATHTIIMGALAVARRRIRICSPYFLPDQQLIGALAVAARRGVEVDIVVPSANNLRLVDFAMTAQFDQLVLPGCRVWRADGPFDHSKLMTVDGLWALVGSSNFDPRSLRLNFELDVEIFDGEIAQALDARMDARIASAWQETREALRARPFVERLRNRIVWLASPYL